MIKIRWVIDIIQCDELINTIITVYIMYAVDRGTRFIAKSFD